MSTDYLIDDQSLFDAAIRRLSGDDEPQVEKAPQKRQHEAISVTHGFMREIKHNFESCGSSVDVTIRFVGNPENREALDLMMKRFFLMEITGRQP